MSKDNNNNTGDHQDKDWLLWPGCQGWSVATTSRQFLQSKSNNAPNAQQQVPSMPQPPSDPTSVLSPPSAPKKNPPPRPDSLNIPQEDVKRTVDENANVRPPSPNRSAPPMPQPKRLPPSVPAPKRSPPPPPQPLSEEEAKTRSDMLSRFDTFMFDCDGVLWLENEPLPGAIQTIAQLQRMGKTVLFVTNNSTKSRAMYLQKLLKFGIKTDSKHVLSSSYAAASWLAARDKEVFDTETQKVLFVGDVGIQEEMKLHGIDTISVTELAGTHHWTQEEILKNGETDDAIGAVVVGADWTFTYSKCAFAIRPLQKDPECLFVSTNQDKTFPVPSRSLPGGGSVVAMVATAAMQQPINVGKPEGWMFEIAAKEFNVDPARTLMVGDRLDTDILFGNRNGASTLLVLTGVTDEGILENVNDPMLKPTFVSPSIQHLMIPEK